MEFISSLRTKKTWTQLRFKSPRSQPKCTIRNYGTGPALDISVQLKSDNGDFNILSAMHPKNLLKGEEETFTFLQSYLAKRR